MPAPYAGPLSQLVIWSHFPSFLELQGVKPLEILFKGGFHPQKSAGPLLHLRIGFHEVGRSGVGRIPAWLVSLCLPKHPDKDWGR